MKKLIKIFFLLLFSLNAKTAYSNQLAFGHNILLVINYNHAYYDSIPFIKKIYLPWFPNIVFYGPTTHKDVHQIDHHEGWFAYIGMEDAMQRYPNYEGYLQLHDDCILNCWNLIRCDKTKIWISKTTGPAPLDPHKLSGWVWWNTDVGYSASVNFYDNLPNSYKYILEKNCGPSSVNGGYADILYIPKNYCNKFIELSQRCKKANLFLELAIPTIYACLDLKENYEILNGIPWGGDIHNYRKNLDYVHPIKLSNHGNRNFIETNFKH